MLDWKVCVGFVEDVVRVLLLLVLCWGDFGSFHVQRSVSMFRLASIHQRAAYKRIFLGAGVARERLRQCPGGRELMYGNGVGIDNRRLYEAVLP